MNGRDPLGHLAQTGIRTVKRAGRLLDPRRVTGLLHRKTPGSAPGIAARQLAEAAPPAAPAAEPVTVTCIDYAPAQHAVHESTNGDRWTQPPRPEWATVRWINVDGLGDHRLIGMLAERYNLHPLAIEDMLHIPQRPKVDVFAHENQGGGQDQTSDNGPPLIFAVMQMLRLIDDKPRIEQVSVFLLPGLVLTFQESRGDVWDPIRQRIATSTSKLRANDASYLLYALLDAMVDHHFPILEWYGNRLEELEMQLGSDSGTRLIAAVHEIKRELLLLRREVWPMREVVHNLQRDGQSGLSEQTRTYLRDVHDHALQVADIIETYREIAVSLADTYMTLMSNRMNETMKTLTVIATIFIPITFLAGVYGMNFRHMPELDAAWAYPAFWALCLAVAGGLLWWFRRKRWL